MRPHPPSGAATTLVLLAIGLGGCGSGDGDPPTGVDDPGALLRSARAALAATASDTAVGWLLYAGGVRNQSAELQGLRPGAPDSSVFREILAFVPDGRLAHQYEHLRIDGTRERVREIYEGGTKAIHILDDSVTVRLLGGPEAAGIDRMRRRVPAALLAEALAAVERGDTAPTRGTPAGTPPAPTPGGSDERGVIRFRPEDGPTLDLIFDAGASAAGSGLSAVAYDATLPGLGDTRVRWTFGDWREVDGVGLLPHRYDVLVGDETFLAMTVDSAVVDGEAARRFLEAPAGFRGPFEVPAPDGDASARARVEELEDGVYRVRNLRTGFHPLFVEFRDFVVAVDAPAGYPLLHELPAGDVAPGPAPDWLSRRYLELIAEAVPEKPVRHVVLTHFHNDHAGGARAFIAAGATVHAPASDTAAIRAYYGAPHEHAPDALSDRSVPLLLEVVADRQVISDGERSLEILAVGPNPHAHGMLVAHLPGEEILFVSDLANGLPAEDPAAALEAEPPLAFLFDWLESGGLDPARIYTMHGVPPIEGAARHEAYTTYTDGT